MKKFAFAAGAAIAIAALSSCNGGTPSASLKDDVDTVSYAIGMAQSQGVKMYLADRLGIDTAYVDEFLKGVTDGATASEDKKKAAYYAGINIGQQIGTQIMQGVNYELFAGDSTQTASLKNLLAGFGDGVKGTGIFQIQEAQQLIQQKIEAIKAESMEKQFGEYKKENEAYLAKNAKAEGVTVLPSGVQYKVLKEGTGAVPADTTRITVKYEGKTIDGQVFDTSEKRGGTVDIRPREFIPGAKEALTKMPVGSVWEVTIPQEQGYGARAMGQAIKPFSTLIFTFEVVAIK